MSSNKEDEKKKKSRPKLSIKIFSGSRKKKNSLKQIHEEQRSVDGSLKEKEQELDKKVEEDVTQDSTESDASDNSIPEYSPFRRRSLSACADFLDTRIKIKAKDVDEEDGEAEQESDDQLSPLPFSPTRSCLRRRAATICYDGEIFDDAPRPRCVSFSPDTVDPPPRNMKYREWIEARSRAPPVNVKHEKHKQKMNQMKKVNMSDYLISRKLPSAGILSSGSSPFGGGGMMM